VTLCLRIWGGLLVPLFVLLSCAACGQIEFANRGLKRIFALPVSRRRVYAAKLASSAGSAILATVAFYLAALVVGVLSGVIVTAADHADIVEATSRAGLVLSGAILLSALHLALSVNLSSYSAVISGGIAAMLVGFFLLPQLGRYAVYFPWSLSISATVPGPLPVLPLLVWMLVLGSGASVLGAHAFSRRVAS